MRGRAAQAATVAEQRLAELAAQWRPTPPPPTSGLPDPRPTAPDWAQGPVVRVHGWTVPALRGLAVLVVAVLAVAGYAVWQAQPRAVTPVPVTVATGAPMPGAEVNGDAVNGPATNGPATNGPAPSGGPASPAAAGPPSSAAGASAPAAVNGASAPAAAEVVVHVAGLVARPGLVRLPAGSRVADAVAAAGGVTQRRAADSVNLARVLVDGEQVVVTARPPAAGAAVAGPSTAGAAAPPAIVDLNVATAESLDALPGVGPVLAARIVAWRTTNGPFRSVDELGEVSGIGDAILGQLRPLVRV